MGAISRGFVPGRDRLFIRLRFLARPAFSPFSALFSSTALRCPPTLPHFRGGAKLEILVGLPLRILIPFKRNFAIYNC